MKNSSKDYENTLVNIKVIGVGGGGNNAITDIRKRGVGGVEFMIANTDEQDLAKVPKETQKIKLGKFNERGLGAGANPNIGKKAALESEDDIKEALEGTDMVIVVAGMGGGTGTGAAPVISRIAKEMNILTLGLVTTPFETEGQLRADNAERGVKDLKENVDSLITISNEKLNSVYGKKSLTNAFSVSNNIMHRTVKMIADSINNVSLINIDFADVKRIVKNQGTAIAGTAIIREGENRAMRAAAAAVTDPILESTIDNAQAAIVSVSGSSSITLEEVNEAVKTIQYLAGKKTNIIFGVTINDDLKDDVMVSVIATGITRLEKVQGFSEKWAEKVIKRVKKEDKPKKAKKKK
ncbi:MAG: cell division protein FtsZ [Mycoplasmatales bacterium]|nr:cell division protein FtsZ [Mycoplasmatales bacterium]